VFEFGSHVLQLNPRSEDIVGAEIAMLTFENNGGWMAWRPGEDTFAHLR
jgi:hypothetical protein